MLAGAEQAPARASRRGVGRFSSLAELAQGSTAHPASTLEAGVSSGRPLLASASPSARPLVSPQLGDASLLLGSVAALEPGVHANGSLPSQDLLHAAHEGLSRLTVVLTSLAPRHLATVQTVQGAMDELMARWRISTSASLDGMGALEAEVLRQVRMSDGLRAALGDAEARVRDLTDRLRVDEQLAELRLAVKEGITSGRVRRFFDNLDPTAEPLPLTPRTMAAISAAAPSPPPDATLPPAAAAAGQGTPSRSGPHASFEVTPAQGPATQTAAVAAGAEPTHAPPLGTVKVPFASTLSPIPPPLSRLPGGSAGAGAAPTSVVAPPTLLHGSGVSSAEDAGLAVMDAPPPPPPPPSAVVVLAPDYLHPVYQPSPRAPPRHDTAETAAPSLAPASQAAAGAAAPVPVAVLHTTDAVAGAGSRPGSVMEDARSTREVIRSLSPPPLRPVPVPQAPAPLAAPGPGGDATSDASTIVYDLTFNPDTHSESTVQDLVDVVEAMGGRPVASLALLLPLASPAPGGMVTQRARVPLTDLSAGLGPAGVGLQCSLMVWFAGTPEGGSEGPRTPGPHRPLRARWVPFPFLVQCTSGPTLDHHQRDWRPRVASTWCWWWVAAPWCQWWTSDPAPYRGGSASAAREWPPYYAHRCPYRLRTAARPHR